MKNGGKNKNVAFIILFSVFNSIIDATAMTLLYENWTVSSRAALQMK